MFDQVHIDVPLGNFAVDFQPAESIADLVAPIISVPKQSDGYFIFDQAPQFRRESDRRSPGTEARKVQLTTSTATYYCPNYELMGSVTVEEMGNADPVVRSKLEQKRVATVRNKIDLGREVRLAVAMHASCGSRAAVASDWNDHANSDPYSDIRTAMRNIWRSTGYWPNKAVTNGLVWDHLSQNQKIIDAIANPNVTTRAGLIPNAQAVAQLLGLSALYVGRKLENATEEGAALALTDVWSNSFLIYYAPDGATMDDPTFLAQFRWMPDELAALGAQGMYVQRHMFETKAKKQDFSLGHYTSETTVFSAAGYALTAAAT